MKVNLILVFVGLFIFNFPAIAQYGSQNVKHGSYIFKTKYDTGKYSTSMIIIKNGKTIFKENYEGSIGDIKEYDLNKDGKKEYLVEMFSGGAHCCTSLFLGKFIDDKFRFTDTIFWGNSFYSVEDLNKDGKYEIEGYNDMFAYAFTNYAESKFPLLIYLYNGNKFMNITSDYPELVQNQLDEFISDLKLLTDTGFQCSGINEDTFNTDAGSVKTILAAIVANYHLLGDVDKGYQLVDSVYQCPDNEKFKQILKTEYNLK